MCLDHALAEVLTRLGHSDDLCPIRIQEGIFGVFAAPVASTHNNDFNGFRHVLPFLHEKLGSMIFPQPVPPRGMELGKSGFRLSLRSLTNAGRSS